MSKLAAQDKFLDLSDYGRTFGRIFALQLKNTRFTPIHVTLLFGISGLIAMYCILYQHYVWAAFFIILKSIIDAADGELARLKKTPSYSGRYLDSIFDIFLNFGFLMVICYVSSTSLWFTIVAFFAIQLQGTLYNYYYVILRHNTDGGERTSKIIEDERPKAFPIESQNTVDFLYDTYNILYGAFDKLIFKLDKNASDAPVFPKWFMSIISIYGLGFQLLLISILLSIGLIEFIIPFFIGYNVFILVFVGIRKAFLNSK